MPRGPTRRPALRWRGLVIWYRRFMESSCHALFLVVLVGCVGDAATISGADGGVDASEASTCLAPMTLCTNGSASTCTDTSSDDKNCGMCKNACPSTAICKASACSCTDTKKTFCSASAACVDTMTDPSNCGACGTKCVNANCSAGTCDKIVFATSAPHPTDFAKGQSSAATAGDSICASAAAAAKLPGIYMAWISDATTTPAAHFTTKAKVHYALVDGTVVANDWSSLLNTANAPLLHAINKDENGADTGTAQAMTNTSYSGAAGGAHCTNWTSTLPNDYGLTGATNMTTSAWTNVGTDVACGSGSYRLYCFQQ